ncbi:MAG: metal ABC transporter permease [Candidatus Cloacimonetes bacterium]|nr:metal ABC transporter permease [Candidatus Cloacimonadota bacterium]
MNADFEIQLIAVLVSVACALPGVFLVLRKMSMMSDSITHTILLGIVLAFFMTHDLNSPYLIIGAALMGVITVWLTETLTKTRLLSEDSAIGVVFPLLFSIAIILITRYAGSVHLDTDSVLLGELAFAPFDRMILFGRDIGAKAIYTSGILLVLNITLISIFFKELKIASFDPLLAAVLGFSPVILHYGLMTLVSLTAVGAFEAVGSVLVVAFMIGPPVTAYLLTDSLKTMLFLSAIFGALSGILGYHIAYLLDVSIAGSMAVMTGIIFAMIFIFSSKRGLIGVLIRKNRNRKEYAQTTLLLHVCNHQNGPNAREENGINSIAEHLHWEQNKLEKTIYYLLRSENIRLENGLIVATPLGIKKVENEKIKLFGN